MRPFDTFFAKKYKFVSRIEKYCSLEEMIAMTFESKPLPENTLVLIPARMASTRLPDKPLADIAGKPMIIRVAEKAKAANIGEIIIATDSKKIISVCEAAGFKACLTSADHQSGSDRIFEALEKSDPDKKIEYIVNVQGDLPTLDPSLIQASVDLLSNSEIDIGTLGTVIVREEEKTNPNVVKIIGTPSGEKTLRALYFSRATAPSGEGDLYHHIGLYAYRRSALEKFISLPMGYLEKRETLEQLRALENGMRIEVAIVDTQPLGVDTPADLEKARTEFQ